VVAYEAWLDITTCVQLRRGILSVKRKADNPRLIHAVVICEYKEPLDVLEATVNSLADTTLAAETIVVLACESRDAQARPSFEELRAKFGNCFRDMLLTLHDLAPGEVAGKSSNENHSVRQLYAYTQREGLDPDRIMVTICDADSNFDPVFFEQVEDSFWRQPNGRQFIYNAPWSCRRNLATCDLIVHSFDLDRCHYDMFVGEQFRYAQSNYSLILGFAHDTNYWDPTNTSEDMHTTLKALAFGGPGVVRVWSIIENDAVTDSGDRWVQALRHMWGVEEVAWMALLYPKLPLHTWYVLMTRAFTVFCEALMPAPIITVLIMGMLGILDSFSTKTRVLAIAYFVAWECIAIVRTALREWFIHNYVLAHRKDIMATSTLRWVLILVSRPVLLRLGHFVYNFLATWVVLFRMARGLTTWKYIVAPKFANPSKPRPVHWKGLLGSAASKNATTEEHVS
jgi:hypothetical protein